MVVRDERRHLLQGRPVGLVQRVLRLPLASARGGALGWTLSLTSWNQMATLEQLVVCDLAVFFYYILGTCLI